MPKTYNKIIYDGQTLIDLTADTITPADLAYGVTAHDASGAEITGSSTKDSDTSDATALASDSPLRTACSGLVPDSGSTFSRCVLPGLGSTGFQAVFRLS